MQAVRIAGQKQLNAHVSTMGTTYVRSALGLPVMLVYLIAVMWSRVRRCPPRRWIFCFTPRLARWRRSARRRKLSGCLAAIVRGRQHVIKTDIVMTAFLGARLLRAIVGIA